MEQPGLFAGTQMVGLLVLQEGAIEVALALQQEPHLAVQTLTLLAVG